MAQDNHTITCYHEAGHAYAALTRGIYVDNEELYSLADMVMDGGL